MIQGAVRNIVWSASVAMVAMLAACTTPAPKTVATPRPVPTPVAVVIPPRPMAPGGASAYFVTPQMGPDGKRITVNSNLSAEERLWHLRAAYNVAALNCSSPQHMIITDHYNQFLRIQARGLTAANTAIDRRYRAANGSAANSVRDRTMTQVYNYFALPPVLPQFCDTALLVAQESVTVAPADLLAFGDRGLAQMGDVHERFFNAFEQWQRDVAAWDARYGASVAPPSPAPTPGPMPTPRPGG